jgi:hypothetical protein
MAGRRGRAVVSVLTLVVGAGALAGCNTDGFDSGLMKQCAMSPDFRYVNQADCPGDPATIFNSGQAWYVGNDASTPGGGHCFGIPKNPYRISSDGSTPLKMTWTKTATGYTVFQGNIKDACVDKTDLSFGMFNPKLMAAPHLHTHHEIQLVGRAGTNHIGIGMYMRDPATGARYTLMLNPRPNSLGDDRFNNPKPGILFVGSSERKGSHLIILDAAYFGFSKITTAGFTTFDVNWDSLLSYVQSRGYWSDLWPVLSRFVASVEVETQTLGFGSRLRINHRGWRQSNS